ncbi:MAG: ABC transporter ATP-binding protein [Gemmatimonadales bacterium]|nr:MAG: ABC transporter ATP-binding protein [Gemmatimonadales bacterium]
MDRAPPRRIDPRPGSPDAPGLALPARRDRAGDVPGCPPAGRGHLPGEPRHPRDGNSSRGAPVSPSPGTGHPLTAPTNVLEADGLGKAFGRQAVLKAASFNASAGLITARVGRDGTGKSTMLRIAAGRMRADYGRILWKGRFVERPSLPVLARDGLMYSSQGSALTRLFTLGQHLDAFVSVYGGGDRVDPMLAGLLLGELVHRKPTTMSGGERQRASLGLALVRAPECLLMDEPFAGVAPLDRPLIARGLQLMKARGAAIVISGHDVEDLFALADQVIWVVAGTSHWIGRPEEAKEHAQFTSDYLGSFWRGGGEGGKVLSFCQTRFPERRLATGCCPGRSFMPTGVRRMAEWQNGCAMARLSCQSRNAEARLADARGMTATEIRGNSGPHGPTGAAVRQPPGWPGIRVTSPWTACSRSPVNRHGRHRHPREDRDGSGAHEGHRAAPGAPEAAWRGWGPPLLSGTHSLRFRRPFFAGGRYDGGSIDAPPEESAQCVRSA